MRSRDKEGGRGSGTGKCGEEKGGEEGEVEAGRGGARGGGVRKSVGGRDKRGRERGGGDGRGGGEGEGWGMAGGGGGEGEGGGRGGDHEGLIDGDSNREGGEVERSVSFTGQERKKKDLPKEKGAGFVYATCWLDRIGQRPGKEREGENHQGERGREEEKLSYPRII